MFEMDAFVEEIYIVDCSGAQLQLITQRSTLRRHRDCAAAGMRRRTVQNINWARENTTQTWAQQPQGYE